MKQGCSGAWRTFEQGPEVCLIDDVWNTLRAQTERNHMPALLSPMPPQLAAA